MVIMRQEIFDGLIMAHKVAIREIIGSLQLMNVHNVFRTGHVK